MMWQIKYSNSSSKYIVIVVVFVLWFCFCNRIVGLNFANTT